MFSTETIYEVIVFSVGDTKAGTKMGKLQLKDPDNGATLNCILWEETLNRMEDKMFRAGNLVRIVSATFNEKFNNCLISALELVKEAKAGLSEPQRNEAFKELLDWVGKIKNTQLNAFLKNYINEHEHLIKISPAAKLMHHNYVGGLLVHTLECLKYAQANLEISDYKLNPDEMFAACILHDIGKIFEYKIDEESGLIDYDENFRKDWLTHSQYGFSVCMHEGFKPVARMIAAHHGRSDWGAIIDLDARDLEPELYFIHLVDNLSAKFGKTSVNMLPD